MPKQTDSQTNSSASSPVHNQNTATTEGHPASDGRVATFIRKVYNILEEQLFPDIVDWSQDGLSIVIKKPTEFSQKVLPKYFKHNHISSFIRQLNMYSFQKKRSRHAGHIYAHDLFQRGAKHLLCQIKRKVKDFANTSTGSGQDLPPIANSTGNGNNNATPSNVVNSAGNPDINNLINENQILKNLQEQAMSKMQALEQRIKELTNMNQNLHAQLQGKSAMENNNMKQQEQQKVQHIYNLNKAMLVGVKNPFVMNGNVKQEDEIQSLSPVKGLSLRINKPAGQNEPERFMIGGSNTFTIGPNFINTNPNIIKPTMMSMDDVSPSTRPSPPNSDNIPMPVNPEINQWGHQLIQQQNLQNLQSAQQSFQNLQNLHQQRLSIGQAHGFFSNLSEPKEPLNISGFGNNNLGKRELELEDIKQMEEPLRKFMQKGWNDHAATLNLSDIRKFHSNLFSSIGDKDFDPKPDTEVDLLCFE